jgi:HSP20 family protein
MTLWRYRPQPFTLLDRLFDEMTASGYGGGPMPRADADGWTVQLALPGVPPETIELTADGRTLSVAVDQRSDEEREEGSYQGAMTGKRAWSWALPDGVDPDQIRATAEYGVLTIRIPKAENAKPRRISVSGSSGARQVGPGAGRHSSAEGAERLASTT